MVFLCLLYCSAAFDLINHSILLHCLGHRLCITGPALNWFKLYLSGRTQNVAIGSSKSTAHKLACGVPHGSVLGPKLFTIYTLPWKTLYTSTAPHSISMLITLSCTWPVRSPNVLVATKPLSTSLRHAFMTYVNGCLKMGSSLMMLRLISYKPSPNMGLSLCSWASRLVLTSLSQCHRQEIFESCVMRLSVRLLMYWTSVDLQLSNSGRLAESGTSLLKMPPIK